MTRSKSSHSNGGFSYYPSVKSKKDMTKEINRYWSFTEIESLHRTFDSIKYAENGLYYNDETHFIVCFYCSYQIQIDHILFEDILMIHKRTECAMTGSPFNYPSTNRSFTTQISISDILSDLEKSGKLPKFLAEIQKTNESSNGTQTELPDDSSAQLDSNNQSLGAEQKTTLSGGNSPPDVVFKLKPDDQISGNRNDDAASQNNIDLSINGGNKPPAHQPSKPPSTLDDGLSQRSTLFSMQGESVIDDDEEQWYENAKEPNFASYDIRFASFRRWPPGVKTKPTDLAAAGFYYTGLFDNVKCFFCGGGIRNFGPTDTGWEDHAKWLPNCRFLLAKKGQAFVDEVQIKYRKEEEEKRKKSPAVANAGTIVESTSSQQLEVSVLSTPQARAHIRTLEELGYLPEMVKTVLLENYRRTGKMYDDIVDVIDALDRKQQQGVTISKPLTPAPSSLSKKKGRKNKRRRHQEKQAAAATSTEDQEEDSSDDSDESPSSQNEASSGVSHQSVDPSGSSHQSNSSGAVTRAAHVGGASNITQLNTNDALESLNQQRQDILESRNCIICLDSERDTVMLPCAHLIACSTCAARVDNCPFCRKRIKGTVKVFM